MPTGVTRGRIAILRAVAEPVWVASIIHLTDMHLHLDDRGEYNLDYSDHIELMMRMAYKFDSVRWRSLFKGLSEHIPDALRHLQRRLHAVIAKERQRAVDMHGAEAGAKVPIVVLQTGDVEAYGARPRPRPPGGFDFLGWDYLDKTLAPILTKADPNGANGWVDVFGNHDAWASAYPLTEWRAHRRVMKAMSEEVPGRLGPAQPSRFSQDWELAGGRRLEVFRASSVPADWLSGVRARGELTPHPLGDSLPLTQGGDALAELEACVAAARVAKPRAVRILALHHPVHAFDASRLKELATAGFAGRDDLAHFAGRVPFPLVIAGHRHKLDPAEDARYDATTLNQFPLPSGVGQLVAESPTMHPVAFDNVRPAEEVVNSFSLYRLLLDDERGRLEVRRTVFRREHDLTAQPFRAEAEDEPVLTNLRIE